MRSKRFRCLCQVQVRACQHSLPTGPKILQAHLKLRDNSIQLFPKRNRFFLSNKQPTKNLLIDLIHFKVTQDLDQLVEINQHSYLVPIKKASLEIGSMSKQKSYD